MSKLPRHGVGTKLTRRTWGEDSYWEVTEVVIEQNGKRGKVYGILTWRGERQNEHKGPTRVNGTVKKVWKILDDGSQHKKEEQTIAWPSFALSALKSEQSTAESSETSTDDTEKNSSTDTENLDASSKDS